MQHAQPVRVLGLVGQKPQGAGQLCHVQRLFAMGVVQLGHAQARSQLFAERTIAQLALQNFAHPGPGLATVGGRGQHHHIQRLITIAQPLLGPVDAADPVHGVVGVVIEGAVVLGAHVFTEQGAQGQAVQVGDGRHVSHVDMVV